MKIRIIGGPGSGKTTLARRLSREMGIPHYDLDELQWRNTGDYGIKRDAVERERLLSEIMAREDWIIEGVYYAWCGETFASADRIYLLTVPRRVYRYRLIRRFIRRKLGREPGKRESLGSLRELLQWADKFQQVNLPAIREILAPVWDKVVEVG
ncbi:MAG: AAA family ATPase [Oscillospiraceae bacterium]|nr:AAA family ATPase [Oscillospiraceae bacterium]